MASIARERGTRGAPALGEVGKSLVASRVNV